MFSIVLQQQAAFGNGRRQRHEVLGTFSGPQKDVDAVIERAWGQRTIDERITLGDSVTDGEMLTALRSPHLIEFRYAPQVAPLEASPAPESPASVDASQLGPTLAAADDEPDDADDDQPTTAPPTADKPKRRR